MLIYERVLCDECLCDMGQLYHLPVQDQERLTDFRTAPDYCLCPDCKVISERAADQQQEADQ